MLLPDIDSFFDLPTNVYMTDLNGNVLECNDIQANCLGKDKASDLVGCNLHDFIEEEESKIIIKNNFHIHQTQTPKIYIEKASINQQLQFYLSYKLPVLNAAKKIVSIVGTSISLNNDNLITQEMFSAAKSTTNKAIAGFACQTTAPLKIEGKTVSKREQSCLYYLISGMTAKGIARKLGLSPRTVEYYISRMKEKFNCTSKMELIIKAISASESI